MIEEKNDLSSVNGENFVVNADEPCEVECSKMSDDEFLDILNKHFVSSNIDMTDNLVKGKIVSVKKDKGYILVDTNLKSESIVPMKEFFREKDKQDMELNAEIDVYLSSLDHYGAGTNVSREKAIREESWQKIVQAHKNNEPVEGIIFAKTRSGLVVDIDAVICFLPGSQVDSDSFHSHSELMGKKEQMMIIHLDEALRNVVVSRKAVRDLARKEFRDDFLNKLNEGDIVEGYVKNITPYGAFVNLGDIDGLLHITDISWERVGHPAEILKIGQKLQVKVLKFLRSEAKISLGLKQLTPNPWSKFEDQYKPGAKVTGKIVNIMNYGLFVKLDNDIEGLVHLSEITWGNDSAKHLRENYQVGQEIEAVVLEMNIEKHRIALGLKQLVENPWKEFVESHKPGDILEGKIANIADFGIFVSITDKIDGLVHSYDIAWGNDGKIPTKYKVGDLARVMYLEGDHIAQKIRLSIKQITENAVNDHAEQLKVDKIVDCVVFEKRFDGVGVELLNGAIVSFIRKSDLGSGGLDAILVDQTIKAKIISYNNATKKLVLSIKEYEDSLTYGSASGNSTTLGDIINSN